MIATNKFIQHNEYFFKNKNKKKNKIFLIEFNGWQAIHIIFSYVVDFFKNEKDCKIVAYECYDFLNRLDPPWYNKYLWKLGIFLNVKTFKIFKSFGTDQFLKPTYSDLVNDKAEKILKKFYLNKPDLKKLENYKIENIWIGDLIYDSFLKKNYLLSIDIHSQQFKDFFKNSLKLYLFWKNYFNKNKISGICVCHSVYLTGIPLRIAQSKQLDCLSISSFNCDLINLSNSISFKEKNNGSDNHYKYFKEIFLKFSKNNKKKYLNEGKKILHQITSGKKKYFYMKKKTFRLSKFKISQKKTSKIKVAIYAHDFTDSPHIYGNHFFSDFKSWFDFLDKIIKRTDYEWYIKIHPGENEITKNEIFKLIKKNDNINLLEKNFPSNHLTRLGVKFVLTVFGTIASELPFYGIRVINASRNNPHYNYDFSLNPTNLKEYEKLLLNLKRFKGEFNYNKNDLYMYHFIKELLTKNSFFENTKRYFDFSDKVPLRFTPQIYENWIEDFNLKIHNRIKLNLKNFIQSKKYLLFNENITTF